MSNCEIKSSWSDEVEGVVSDNKNKRTRAGSREQSNERKKHKPNTNNKPRKHLELETNPQILQRRQKQINYGKNTVGYQNFIQQVPFDQRTKDQPKTPEKFVKYSRRSWDTLIKIWRKKLHNFDPNVIDGVDTSDDNSSDDGWDTRSVSKVSNTS